MKKGKNLYCENGDLLELTNVQIRDRLRQLELFDLNVIRRPTVKIFTARCPFCSTFETTPLVLDSKVSFFHCLHCEETGNFDKLVRECYGPNEEV